METPALESFLTKLQARRLVSVLVLLQKQYFTCSAKKLFPETL